MRTWLASTSPPCAGHPNPLRRGTPALLARLARAREELVRDGHGPRGLRLELEEVGVGDGGLVLGLELELRLAHQVAVDHPRALATLGDGRDDERLADARVAAREHRSEERRVGKEGRCRRAT